MQQHNYRFKNVFWQEWQIQKKQELHPAYAIESYIADFAHLPTKTIIEIDPTAPNMLHDQVKQAGWQVVQLQRRDLERDIQACIQKISTLLTNKGVYLQKKGQMLQPGPRKHREVDVVTLPPPSPTCSQCGHPRSVEENLCAGCLARNRSRQGQQATIAWAKELMKRRDWIVFDTETTGLTRESEVIEIAILDSQGRVLLDTLVKPQERIPYMTTRVHGIADKDVVGAPTFAEVWPQIAVHFQKNLVLAYNIAFDLRILAQSAQRYGIVFPQNLVSACLMKTCVTYLRADRDGPSRASLEKVCEHLGIVPNGSHRALSDTQATWEIVKKLSEKK